MPQTDGGEIMAQKKKSGAKKRSVQQQKQFTKKLVALIGGIVVVWRTCVNVGIFVRRHGSTTTSEGNAAIEDNAGQEF